MQQWLLAAAGSLFALEHGGCYSREGSKKGHGMSRSQPKDPGQISWAGWYLGISWYGSRICIQMYSINVPHGEYQSPCCAGYAQNNPNNDLLKCIEMW